MENKLLNKVSSYEEMITLMKKHLSVEEFELFKEVENQIDALDGGYYDTHNLLEIEENIEPLKHQYAHLVSKVFKEVFLKINKTYK